MFHSSAGDGSGLAYGLLHDEIDRFRYDGIPGFGSVLNDLDFVARRETDQPAQRNDGRALRRQPARSSLIPFTERPHITPEQRKGHCHMQETHGLSIPCGGYLGKRPNSHTFVLENDNELVRVAWAKVPATLQG